MACISLKASDTCGTACGACLCIKVPLLSARHPMIRADAVAYTLGTPRHFSRRLYPGEASLDLPHWEFAYRASIFTPSSILCPLQCLHHQFDSLVFSNNLL